MVLAEWKESLYFTQKVKLIQKQLAFQLEKERLADILILCNFLLCLPLKMSTTFTCPSGTQRYLNVYLRLYGR